MIRKVAVAQLLLQALGKALLDGEGIVFGALVLAPVVHVKVVGRNVVVLGAVVLLQGTAALLLGLYLRDGDIAGFVIRTALGGVIHHRVVVQYLPHMLLQCLHRHLDQLDSLNLKR